MENRIVGYEPYSEVLAYRIGKILGLDCIPYSLVPVNLVNDVKFYGSIKHGSICRVKNLSQRMSFYSYMSWSGKESTDPLHFYLSSGLDRFYLSKMLAFDAFIGNQDRHLGNFDVYVENGSIRNAPIYDNGASLLAWNSSSYLREVKYGNRLYNDKSKPFKATHKEQIKLALRLNNGNSILGVVNKDSFYDKLFKDCEDIFAVMPDYRVRGIKNYLLNRHIYLV